jgi:hypothetical protein
MDEINMEPEENLEPLEDVDVQKEQPASPIPPQITRVKKLIIPGSIAISVLLIVIMYFIFFASSGKIIAQATSLNAAGDPAVLVISITNKEEEQVGIRDLSLVFYKRGSPGSLSKSINTMIQGKTLPFTIDPEDVNVIKMNFHIDIGELAAHCDSIQDSSRIVVSPNGLSKNQLEGYLGLSWKVTDSDDNSFNNHTRLIYFVIAPSTEGSAESLAIVKSELIMTEPFELCTQLEEEETQ